jgi:hypothetical protein
MQPENKPEKDVGAVTVLELLVIAVVVGLVAILLALSINKPHSHLFCPNNLKQVGAAFITWAEDNQGLFPMQVSLKQGGTAELVDTSNVFVHFLVMSNYLNTPKILRCPADTTRTEAASYETNFDNSNISYFVGADALKTNASMLLCGDRNLALGTTAKPGFLVVAPATPVHWTSELHNAKGCFLFPDGSVNAVYDRDLQSVLRVCNTTNRLVLP